MKLFDTLAEMGHEEVVMCSDPSVGYKGILAVHSTKLGPALGGTRFWQYATDEDAITDALRLSRGMTYKNAVAGLHLRAFRKGRQDAAGSPVGAQGHDGNTDQARQAASSACNAAAARQQGRAGGRSC